MKTILTICASVAVSLLGTYMLVSYVPLSFFPDTVKHLFGSTITTIQGTDTISGSRTTINTNFSNLNTDKIEATVTTLSSLTSAASLATVGSITSGTWSATPVTATFGGTGSTTLSSNQVLIGNGTGILKTINGFGTSGQFLTSNGAGLVPTWQSASVDQTLNYSWTGTHAFNNAASTTIATGLYANTIAASYFDATSTTATSTFVGGVFMTNATTTNLEVGGICRNCATNGYSIVTNTAAGPTVANNGASVQATCATGKKVVGGGGNDSVSAHIWINHSYPAADNIWEVQYLTDVSGAAANTMTVYAICVN